MPVLRDKKKRNEIRHQFYQKLANEGETIPDAIKTLRKILAMDQQKFADHVGISVSTLRKIEQDNSNVNLDSIQKILQQFSLKLMIKTK